MASRIIARKLSMQILFQCSFQEKHANFFLEDLLSFYLEEYVSPRLDSSFLRQMVLDVWEHREELDVFINRYAIGWTVDRLFAIDKIILRMAFYELMYTDVDENIVLNEAINLAKEYSIERSYVFINGILGRYVSVRFTPCLQD